MPRPSTLASRILLVIALLTLAQGSFAQTPEPAGIVGPESDAEPWPGAEHRTFKDAISGDGRYVVFTRSLPGAYWGDVLLRDRHTRELRQLNVAANGTGATAPSAMASISASGRHVTFVACGTLTADDTNTVCDLYARDLELNTLARLSIGPAGESPQSDAGFGSISNDGRFVAFTAVFNGANGYPRRTWLRDRDADENGVFDEPGTGVTTLVSVKSDGTPAASDYSVSLNGNDARFIAFTSWEQEVVPGYTPDGARLYVRDRLTATTFRVDVPFPGAADEGWSLLSDLSDDGSIVAYETTVRAGQGDEDSEFDVYVFNLWTGGNLLVTPDDGSGPVFERVTRPSVSGDGRHVAVLGQLIGHASWETDVWTYDRETRQGRQVTRPLPGWDSTYQILEVALNQDGSEALFSGYPHGLVHDQSAFQRAVFVATDATLTPAEQTASAGGGTYTGTVVVRDGIAWSVRTLTTWLMIDTTSGNGPGTFTYTVTPNLSGQSRTAYIWLGNRQLVVTQPAAPGLDWVDPSSGPMTGGTVARIHGQGFQPGARVLFGELEAITVTFVDSQTLEVVTPTQTRSGPVAVTVMIAEGSVAVQPNGFWYIDSTRPEISRTLTGPQGLDGIYLDDVTLTWTVTDPESEVRLDGCESRAFTEDGYYYSYCRAESAGGDNFWSVAFTRDATSPGVDIWWPPSAEPGVPFRVVRDGLLSASYQCTDQTSGVVSCVGDVPSGEQLNTTTAGGFTLTVRAQDRAGWYTTKQVPYVVLPPTSLSLAAASGPYGGTAMLSATLTADGVPLAGRLVNFSGAHLPAGFAVTDANGVAATTVPLGTLTTGTYPLSANFYGDDDYFSGVVQGQVTITKATPQLTWAAPAPIVYPTLLSTVQLNASANVDGMYHYSHTTAAPPSPGVHTLSVTFTPSDTVNYNQATASVTLTVTKPVAIVTWGAPAAIVYGTPLGGAQLTASANYPGTFSYAPAAGSVLPAGTHTLTVVFTPTDPNVDGASKSVALTVFKAPTQFSWIGPSPIVYGTALGPAQLNATANVPGTFAYQPAAGAVLEAGTQALSVTFTPTDSNNYQSVNGAVFLSVGRAPLTIRATDATKVYGAALPAFSATAAGLVNGETLATLWGALTFTTAASPTSAPGGYTVTPGGLSSQNYTIAFQNGTLTVTKAATTMTLAASPSPSQNNKPVRLDATVAVTSPGSGTPTGSVTFRRGTTVLGTAPIVNGTASLTVSLRKGAYSLTATWNGDDHFTGSSAALTHQVN